MLVICLFQLLPLNSNFQILLGSDSFSSSIFFLLGNTHVYEYIICVNRSFDYNFWREGREEDMNWEFYSQVNYFNDF